MRATRQLTDARNEIEHLAHAVGVDDVGREPQSPELQERLLAISGRGGHHQISPQSRDGLEARRDHSPHARLLERGRRIVAEVSPADETVLPPEGVDQLGDAWYERDDAGRRSGEGDLAAGHIAIREGERGPRRDEAE